MATDSTTTGTVLAAIDAVADQWRSERDERLQRRHLERADFDALAATGFLSLIVPESHGGHWRSLAGTGPVIIDAVQRIARGDHSVGLVASMHPAVQIYWTASPEAAEPYRQAWADQRASVGCAVAEPAMVDPAEGTDVVDDSAVDGSDVAVTDTVVVDTVVDDTEVIGCEEPTPPEGVPTANVR